MDKKFSLFTLVLCLLCLNSFAAVQEDGEGEGVVVRGRHYFFNLSLFYPVSLNRTKEDSVNLNLSLLYGRVGYVRGIDLAGFASVIEHRLQGIQAAGLMSVAGESGQGMQAAGLMSVSGNDFTGLQASGLMSISGEQFNGAQFSGLMSIVGNRATIFQASGLAGIVGERAKGVQVSGLFSVVGDRFVGFQAAGLFNVTGEDFDGFQAGGLFNVAGQRLRGVQIGGLVNVVGEVLHGLQISPFNIAAESRGVHVGVHTLSNFITTNDAYVTPVPDPRLARVGTTRLTVAVGPTDTEIRIENPDFFNQFGNNNLRAGVVGEEIIRYRAVSDAEPWMLLEVERGAFGTRATAHRPGDSIAKLADSPVAHAAGKIEVNLAGVGGSHCFGAVPVKITK